MPDLTVLEALRAAEKRLEQVPEPRLDAEYLLAFVLGVRRLDMLVNKRRTLTGEEAAAYDGLLARRAEREPLQYILGSQSFMGLPFKTDPRALIPRGDTEILCEEALRLIRPGDNVLDLCTGSGCLAVAIGNLCPGARVTATDISAEALSLARENAEALGAGIDFRRGSLFSPVAGERFHVILSNPPYIPFQMAEGLQEEVKREPALALFAGGEKGLALLKEIIFSAPAFLHPRGWLLLEFGDGQAEDVEKMLGESFESVRILTDWQGLPRAACGRKKETGREKER